MACYSVLLACFMALLLLLYSISAAARYYIKFTFFTCFCLFSATLPMPLMLRKPRSAENALIPAWLCLKFGKFLGITYEVRGQENIDNSRGYIVLLNHQSSIDLFPLSVLWPLMKEGCVISKRALFYLWPFGLATWLWGTVFIDRQRQAQAQETVNQTVEAIKTRKAKIFLFPEGTRNSGDELLPFKKGAFHAAIDAGCPIQPIAVSKYYFLDHKRYKFHGGHFIVHILPLVSTEGLTKADIPDLANKCRLMMQEKVKEITSEALQKDAVSSMANGYSSKQIKHRMRGR